MDYETIRKEIEDALAAIGKKHNFTSTLGTIGYTEAGFRASITAKLIDIGNGKSGAQLDYEKNAFKFGIDPDTYGRVFKDNKGTILTVVGINPRARTMPVIVRDGAGKEYKCSVALAGVGR